MKGRTIALLHVDHYEKWTEPFGNFDDMGIKLLMDTNKGAPVQIEVYDAYHGVLPTLEQLKNKDKYMGVYITGSQYDSFDTTTEWINKMRDFIRSYVQDDNQNGTLPPLVGICFAHQILAHALGGTVGRNPEGIQGGVISVTLNDLGEKLFKQQTLNISMIHRDVVLTSVDFPGMKNWGYTPQCGSQGYYKPGCVLTFQGHPEFTSQVARQAWQHSLTEDNRGGITPLQEAQWEHNTSTLANDGYAAAARAIWQVFEREI